MRLAVWLRLHTLDASTQGHQPRDVLIVPTMTFYFADPAAPGLNPLPALRRFSPQRCLPLKKMGCKISSTMASNRCEELLPGDSSDSPLLPSLVLDNVRMMSQRSIYLWPEVMCCGSSIGA